ncbi:cupin domain-containing protein [Streptomyces glaucus]|uniref:Cupin domain-containing protein n=1 Tax=Streptomyces glaucus TaxID=284029 RepID=A0ABN3K731_9ACTN
MTLLVHADRSYLGTPDTADTVSIGTNKCTILIPTHTTGDHLGLFSLSLAPHGPYATPHFHKNMTELFIVASGEVQLTRGNTSVTAGPGTALYVPPGTPHGFANVSDAPAELMIAFTPGAHRERFFLGLADLFNQSSPPTEEELRKFAEQHDQYTYHPDTADTVRPPIAKDRPSWD